MPAGQVALRHGAEATNAASWASMPASEVTIRVDDIVTVKHAVGEWLVEKINAQGELLLRGSRRAYIWERPEHVTFVCHATLADKRHFLTAEEIVRRGL